MTEVVESPVHALEERAHNTSFEQRRRAILTHLLNHQTHHRGQAHMILSICTGREPPALDLLLMQRGITASDLRSLATVSPA